VNTFGQSASVVNEPNGDEPTIYLEAGNFMLLMALRSQYGYGTVGMVSSASGLVMKRRVSTQGMWWLGLL
jgi:hypothetical protein